MAGGGWTTTVCWTVGAAVRISSRSTRAATLQPSDAGSPHRDRGVAAVIDRRDAGPMALREARLVLE
jgi:hypothetical protein